MNLWVLILMRAFIRNGECLPRMVVSRHSRGIVSWVYSFPVLLTESHFHSVLEVSPPHKQIARLLSRYLLKSPSIIQYLAQPDHSHGPEQRASARKHH